MAPQARDRQAEHCEEKILTTIARDPSFRRALADAVSQDHSLKITSDVVQQWQKLILEPLSKVNGVVIGNVVAVIDALDERGSDTSRQRITVGYQTCPEYCRACEGELLGRHPFKIGGT